MVLFASLVYAVIFAAAFLIAESCHDTWCRIHDGDPVGILLFILLPLIPLLLLSLITYKMRESVFRAWWNFARWWVPVIIVFTLLLNNKGGGGYLGMDTVFDGLIYSILYGVLIVTSLVKIVRAYRKK